MSEALYLPDNPGLLGLLDDLPRPLRRYRDHAALLLHFTNAPRWMRRRNDNDEFTRLHSLILRKYIPDRQIKTLRDHLVNHGVLVLDGYSAGRRSIGYRIADEFDGPPLRWCLSDDRLIQKRRAWRESVSSDDTPAMRELAERRRPVTDSMRGTLDHLSLCAEPSQVEQALRGRGIDPTHLRYACSVIANHDHDGLYMDSFGWRVHSIVTYTTAELRPFLRFDRDTLIELDVRNAQPLILAAALRNPALCATYICDAQHSGRRGSVEAALEIIRSVPEQEAQEYSRVCEGGFFYEVLGSGPNDESRDKIKRSVFRDVFFGKVKQHGPVSDAFQKLWPGIYDTLRRLKQAFGYKIVAQVLQRMESTIMIDGVCNRIVLECPDIRFLTIHDAALVVVDQGDTVRQLVEAEFERFGVRAQVKPEIISQREPPGGTSPAAAGTGPAETYKNLQVFEK